MGKISDPHFILIEYFKFIRHLNMENWAIGLNFRIKKSTLLYQICTCSYLFSLTLVFCQDIYTGALL